MSCIECDVVTRPTSLHWLEYLIEAGAIGTFMVSAAVFAAVLYSPSSPISGAISSELARRALMGLAMGSTAVAIIYSPWGQRSGAHMNPAVTLTFFRLGKVARPDVAGYVTAQFAGAIVGIAAAVSALGGIVSDPPVNYVTTLPGPTGEAVAFVAEAVISFVLMLTVLVVSNHRRLAPFTGLCAGLLVWVYVAAPHVRRRCDACQRESTSGLDAGASPRCGDRAACAQNSPRRSGRGAAWLKRHAKSEMIGRVRRVDPQCHETARRSARGRAGTANSCHSVARRTTKAAAAPPECRARSLCRRRASLRSRRHAHSREIVAPCPVRIHYDGGALTTNAGGFTMTAAERTEAQNHANLSRAQSR
jgi:glycerol uptake facilitator-like aquaporin